MVGVGEDDCGDDPEQPHRDINGQEHRDIARLPVVVLQKQCDFDDQKRATI